MDMPNTFLDADFKDESPLKTVEKIKNILHTYGIETVEEPMDSSVPYCYALRVSVVGTTFGSNGKGITEEFALASAYGELMERLQLGYIGMNEVQKDGSYSINDSQNVTVAAKDLYPKNKAWYEAFVKRLHLYTKEETTADAIFAQYADKNGNVVATPYWCLNTETWEYLPTALRKNIYTANGCAAGNTPEEAIVQAMSEIVERHHLIHMMFRDITPPDIPDDVLKTCKVAYDIISYIREKGFRVLIKDCSLGDKFPVISVCIIDRKSGRYHTHFGAYPIFEIALERALTESFQGRSIDNIARFRDFRYKKEDLFDLNVLVNELTKGVSEKLPRFFVGKPQFSYNESVGFTGKNNRELFFECLDFFTAQGYDILVRDSSCLGFPTYQVIIPGYSEIFAHRFSPKYNDRRYGSLAIKTLRNPSAASFEDLLGLMLHLSQTAKMSKNISNAHGFLAGANLCAKLPPNEDAYLMHAALAYVSYTLGKLADTANHIDHMLAKCKGEEEEYLVCVKRYLSLMQNGYGKDEIKEILTYFHTPESIQKFYSCIENSGNPLEPFTLHCDMKCSESCRLYPYCCTARVQELSAIINEKTMEIDPDALPAHIRALRNA